MKVIAEVKDNSLYDKNGVYITSLVGTNYIFEEFKEDESVDVAKLISLGLTSQDLISLKANNII